jgi:hypothetical protein
MLASLIAYVLTPVATYALGFDPSLTVGYVLLFGVAPLALGLATLFPVAFLFTVLFDMSVRERLLGVAGILAASAVVMSGCWHFVHRPETALEIVVLAVASPFIAMLAVSLPLALVFAACAAVSAAGEVISRASRRSKNTPQQ